MVKFEGNANLTEAFETKAEAIAYAKDHSDDNPTVESFDAYFDAFGCVEKESEREIVPLTEADESEAGPEAEGEDEPSLEDRLAALEDAVSELAGKVETIAAGAESPEEEAAQEEPEEPVEPEGEPEADQAAAEEGEETIPDNPFDLDFEPESTEVVITAEVPAEDVERVESPDVKVEIDGISEKADGEVAACPDCPESDEEDEGEEGLEESKDPEFERHEKIADEFRRSLGEGAECNEGWESVVDSIVAG